MLSKRTQKQIGVISETRNVLAGALIGAGLISLVVWAILNQWGIDAGPAMVGSMESQNYVAEIGISLMTTFVLPFELIAILLLVALIGAAKIAMATGKEASE